MVRFFYACALGILLAVSIWLMGFIWFITLIPSPNRLQVNYPTDAIVVLTGGHGRTEQGLALLQRGAAKRLFVSGVHRQTDKTAIFSQFRRKHPAEYARLQSRITLGKRALDTRGNAVETAEWVARNHIKNLRLVTANYHIPRSMIEFERALPRTAIIPAPVYIDHFKTGDWWADKASFKLVMSEYHKTIASLVYGVVKR